MPQRNLLMLFLASVISLLCYQRADRNRYVSTMAEAMNLIDAHYLEEVQPRQLFENAMRGLTEGLDPHSTFINPGEYKQLDAGLKQEFGGIGIIVEVDPESRRLTVLSPLVNTPAYRAGMKAGDVILKINGRDTLGMSIRTSVELIQGPRGEVVRLTVLHAGQEEPVELAIPRDIIHIDSVLGDTRRPDGSWDFALAGHPRITYVRLIQFGEQTVAELRTALQSRLVEALILDLRDNAGGWLDAAVGTCSFFLTSEAEIVSTRGRGGVVLHAFKADGQPLLEARVPIVVLTNHFSASASEIVAACLQDHGRAKVIGQRTWGKGTVQNILKLEGGRSALKLTTASYWRPSGQNIHRRKNAKDTDQWGVTPDAGFEVALTDEQADAVRKHRRERDLNVLGKKSVAETTDGKPAPPLADPQLDKAVDYLEQQLNTSH